MILVHFTCYAQPEKRAAEKFFNEFILLFSIPSRIPQDHKGELKNQLLKKLPQNLGYKNCWSIPYQWFRWKNEFNTSTDAWNYGRDC